MFPQDLEIQKHLLQNFLKMLQMCYAARQIVEYKIFFRANQIDIFHQIRKDTSFKKKPTETITEHLTNKIKQEQGLYP